MPIFISFETYFQVHSVLCLLLLGSNRNKPLTHHQLTEANARDRTSEAIMPCDYSSSQETLANKVIVDR
jgi:hypothetical protein